MAKRYLESIPVSGATQARALGSPSAWEVLQELRSVGLEGLTPKQISERLDMSLGTVYNALEKLQAGGWVEWRRRRKARGYPDQEIQEDMKRTEGGKRIYVEQIDWGGIEFEYDFQWVAEGIISSLLNDDKFARSLCELLDKIIRKFKESRKGKNFLPSGEVCPNCKVSHEDGEFVWAILTYLCASLFDIEEFKKVVDKYGLKVKES